MRIISIGNVHKTATDGYYDMDVVFKEHALSVQPRSLPFTYSMADTEPMSEAVRAYLRAKNINLARVALPYIPFTPTEAHIKAEAKRRIDAAYPAHAQLNLMRRGTPEEVSLMGAFIDGIRQKSRALVAVPPLDYTDDKHWELD